MEENWGREVIDTCQSEGAYQHPCRGECARLARLRGSQSQAGGRRRHGGHGMVTWRSWQPKTDSG